MNCVRKKVGPTTITKQTKLRFYAMLMTRQIIVIQHRTHRGSSIYKFIGANSDGRWDFTPTVIDSAGIDYNRDLPIESLVTKDGLDALVKAVKSLADEGLIQVSETGFDLYEMVRDHITTFQM